MSSSNIPVAPDVIGRASAGERWAQFWERRMDLFIGSASILAFLLLWEWAGTSGVVNPMFTSSPSRIWAAGFQMFADGSIWKDLRVSGIEFGVGSALSILVGIPLGIALGWYRVLNGLFGPFVTGLYATPRVALMPLLIIWLGIGLNSKVAMVFLGAVFQILMTTQSGMRTIDESLLKAARSFGANNWQIFRTVALPATVPFIFTGLRLGLGHGLVGIVVGEMYAATAGIGYLITVAGASFQTDKVFVGVLIIAIVGVALTELIGLIERKFDAWRPDHP